METILLLTWYSALQIALVVSAIGFAAAAVLISKKYIVGTVISLFILFALAIF